MCLLEHGIWVRVELRERSTNHLSGNAPAENIEDWLMPGGNFDIYAIGVQVSHSNTRPTSNI